MKGQNLKDFKIPLIILLISSLFIGCSQSKETPNNNNEEIKTIHFSNANFVSALLEATNIKIILNENGTGNIEETIVNNTKSLDFSKISILLKNLNGIELFKNLETLNCSNLNLSSLDVTRLTNLKNLYCSNSFNKSSSSRSITNTIDLSKNTKLETLECINNKFSFLDVSHNSKLKKLNCSNNLISTLELSNNVELQNLDCSNNQLDSLNLTDNTNLTTLVCGNQKNTNGDEVQLSLELTIEQKDLWNSEWNTNEDNDNVSFKEENITPEKPKEEGNENNENQGTNEPEKPKEEGNGNSNINANIGSWEKHKKMTKEQMNPKNIKRK